MHSPTPDEMYFGLQIERLFFVVVAPSRVQGNCRLELGTEATCSTIAGLDSLSWLRSMEASNIESAARRTAPAFLPSFRSISGVAACSVRVTVLQSNRLKFLAWNSKLISWSS
ncbi:hypothetical protein KCV03_g231, partial [Aureobasidium melanogenum]